MDLETFQKLYGSKKSTPYAGANGVYIVSPSCPTRFWQGERCGNRVPVNVKIGKASGKQGFIGRLRDYLTYWPQGVTIHAILVTPSFDELWHTYKDEALKRETTLKRILAKKKLTGYGANGKGKRNGTEGIRGSEWVHARPDEVMKYMNAVGPMVNRWDRLYGCSSKACLPVDYKTAMREGTRLHSLVRPLGEVLHDEKATGVPGRPVVVTRAIREAAARRGHPLHPFAHRLVTNIEESERLARVRLEQQLERRKRREQAQADAARTRADKRKLKLKQARAAGGRREPRDLAAVRNTLDFAAARLRRQRKARAAAKKHERDERQRDARASARASRYEESASALLQPRHRNRYEKARQAARRLSREKYAESQDHTRPNGRRVQEEEEEEDVRDGEAGSRTEAAGRAPSPPQTRQMTRNRMQQQQQQRGEKETKKQPARKETKKKKKTKMKTKKETKKQPAKKPATEDGLETPRSRRSSKKTSQSDANGNRTCPVEPSRSRSVIKHYDEHGYSYVRVTGDGFCYLYALMRTILPLSGQMGSRRDLSLLWDMIKDSFVTSEARVRWGALLQDPTAHGDPQDLLYQSETVQRLLYTRGIRYAVTISHRNEPNLTEIDEYMRDPLATIRPALGQEQVTQIQEGGHGRYGVVIYHVTSSHRRSQFMEAFRNHQVLTFVFKPRNRFGVKGLEHYDVIVPHSML